MRQKPLCAWPTSDPMQAARSERALMPIVVGLPPLLFPMHIALMELAIDPICALVFESEPSEAAARLGSSPPIRFDNLNWINAARRREGRRE